MSVFTELPVKGKVIHLLRFLSYGLLLSGYFLYFRDLVSPLFWGAALISGFTGAVLTAGRLRFVPAAGVLVLTAVFSRLLIFLIFRAAGDRGDFLYLFFDISFLPFLLPLGIVWIFTYFVIRYPGLLVWETAANSWLLLMLFWSQGHYRLTLLSHPVILAGAVVLYLGIQITALLLNASSGFPGRGSLVFSALIFLAVLTSVSLLFLGRFSQGAVAVGGGLVKPTLFRFDFSRYIQLESEITMSSDLVLLFREEEPAEQKLLRRYVLSGYRQGQGFFLDEPPGTPPQTIALPDRRTELPDPGYWGRMDAVQEYFFVNFDPSSLVALNYPVEITPLRNWEGSPFIRNYRVRSRVAGFLTWELLDARADQLEPELQRYYTDYGGDEAVAELARTVTDGLENYFDRVMAVQSYLLENFYYSLKPGVAGDGDQLHHFLFQSRKGYCSYFAFSMALMCRSLGIPARVAVGFFVDPSLGVMNIYPVRADMAHAWVEIYFPDYGWISFDPTSQTPAPGEDLEFGGIELSQFLSLVEQILANRDSLAEEVPSDPVSVSDGGWRGFLRGFLRQARSTWYFLVPFFWLLFLFLRQIRMYLVIFLSREPRKRMLRLYRLVRCELELFGERREAGESLLEWADRLEGKGVDGAACTLRLYLKCLYGNVFTEGNYRAGLACLRRLHRDFRRRKFSAAPVLRFLIQPLRRFP